MPLLGIISFTVLTVTGLAQLFSSTAPGDWVLGALGGIDLTRGIHRTFGVVATIIGMGASLMVSYTRARAEKLGIKGEVGLGSRSKRMIVVGVGAIASKWSLDALVVSMCLLNLLALWTVILRTKAIYEGLAEK